MSSRNRFQEMKEFILERERSKENSRFNRFEQTMNNGNGRFSWGLLVLSCAGIYAIVMLILTIVHLFS